MQDAAMLELLNEAADAVTAALDKVLDWRQPGTREGQYGIDLAADEAVVGVLDRADVGILSEESGLHRPGAPIVVVVDPLDGSSNASRRIPWYATSLCAVDGDGPFAAVVVNQATGTRYEALRGQGARRDATPIRPTDCADLSAAIVGVTGLPDHDFGWRQFRSLCAIALDLCAVASGGLDAYVAIVRDAHGPWDYMGGLLVCREAGVVVEDLEGRELVAVDYAIRRTPIAAGTQTLLAELTAATGTPRGK